MRYLLQLKDNSSWKNTDLELNSKRELDEFIGQERVDYEFRTGYYFKHWGKPVGRFIHNSGENKGLEVKV